MHAYTFVLFFLALCRPIGGAVIRQSLSLLHFFNFFVVGQVRVPLWVFTCILLTCGGARSDQSEFLRVRNFRVLSTGTADGSINGIFPVRHIVCGSIGYMSRPCWPVPVRYTQVFKSSPYKYILTNIYIHI